MPLRFSFSLGDSALTQLPVVQIAPAGRRASSAPCSQIAQMSLLLVPVRQEVHFGAVEPLHTRAIPPGAVLRHYIKAIMCDYAELTHRRASLRRGVKE